jgi:hypothetical protein
MGAAGLLKEAPASRMVTAPSKEVPALLVMTGPLEKAPASRMVMMAPLEDLPASALTLRSPRACSAAWRLCLASLSRPRVEVKLSLRMAMQFASQQQTPPAVWLTARGGMLPRRGAALVLWPESEMGSV